MKQSTTALLAVLGLAAAGGVIYLATKDSSSSGGGGDNQSRTVRVFEGEQGVWSFAIMQGGTIVHGPEGPFADQAAAQAAGDIWLSDNPVL